MSAAVVHAPNVTPRVGSDTRLWLVCPRCFAPALMLIGDRDAIAECDRCGLRCPAHRLGLS